MEDEIDEGEEEEEEREYAGEDPDDRNCPPHEFECWNEDCVALR